MIFFSESNASLISLPSNPVIPFEDEIYCSFIGYRRCVTENPYNEKSYTRDELIQQYIELCDKFKHKHTWIPLTNIDHDSILSSEDFSLIERVVLHFKRCEFIKNHIAHESPMEHGGISVDFSGSRVFSHQIVRHRLASPSQASQRYINHTGGNMCIMTPPHIAKNPKLNSVYQEHMKQMINTAEKLKEIDPTLKDEDVRYIYPNAVMTSLTITMNLRLWLLFFRERCCQKAQWEIRSAANKLLSDFRLYIPFIYDDAGPKCNHLNRCPEMKPCGKIKT